MIYLQTKAKKEACISTWLRRGELALAYDSVQWCAMRIEDESKNKALSAQGRGEDFFI